MSTATQATFVKDAWQTPRNARTLRAFMALQQREIGERIAELRKSRGNPPQEVVAQQLGVSYRAYQAWEAGDAKPSYRNLSKLAAFYGVSEEYILLGGEMPERQVPQLNRIETMLAELLHLVRVQAGEGAAADSVSRLAAAFAADLGEQPDAAAVAHPDSAVPSDAKGAARRRAPARGTRQVG
jgi:transcriptional regulator with XRE-family HTH domain